MRISISRPKNPSALPEVDQFHIELISKNRPFTTPIG